VLSILDDLASLFNTTKIQDIAEPADEEISDDIAEKVNRHFGFLQGKCPRHSTIILSEADYDKLIGWTISYYRNDLQVPEIIAPIQKVETNKTYLILAFKYLFRVFYPSAYYPDSLFNFYTTAFHPCRDDKKPNFGKVRNQEALKKLMKL
jgi:hypothetical protein